MSVIYSYWSWTSGWFCHAPSTRWRKFFVCWSLIVCFLCSQWHLILQVLILTVLSSSPLISTRTIARSVGCPATTFIFDKWSGVCPPLQTSGGIPCVDVVVYGPLISRWPFAFVCRGYRVSTVPTGLSVMCVVGWRRDSVVVTGLRQWCLLPSPVNAYQSLWRNVPELNSVVRLRIWGLRDCVCLHLGFCGVWRLGVKVRIRPHLFPRMLTSHMCLSIRMMMVLTLMILN